MKRSEALQVLSSDHHASLVLGKKCQETAQSDDQEAIQLLCKKLVSEFEQWDHHFRTEETAIFELAKQKGGQLATICAHLQKEHEQMRAMTKAMAEGDCSPLHEFGEMLYDHTRVEERLLFPLVEQQFSQEELAQVHTTSTTA